MTARRKRSPARSLLSSVVPVFARNWIRKFREARRRGRSRAAFRRSVRSSDIFLVGHPKSGNTWLAYMLAILVRSDHEGMINLANIGDHVPTIHARDFALARFEHLESPRMFRNEGPLYPDLYPKTIYIVRDPRAVLLSYYHHCVHDTGNRQWPLSDFVDEMLTHGCIKRLEPFLIRWDLHVANWIDRAGSQPVKLIRYEDMLDNRETVLRDIAEFIGIDVSDRDLSAAVARGDFDSMRAEEETVGAESYAGEKGEKGFFIRKGTRDSWKQEMPGSISDAIQRSFDSTMRRLGYLS